MVKLAGVALMDEGEGFSDLGSKTHQVLVLQFKCVKSRNSFKYTTTNRNTKCFTVTKKDKRKFE